MKREAFQLLSDAESDHWWFRGRRELIRAVFQRLPIPRDAHLLDAGCGSGGNLPLLAEFGHVSGFEYDEHALQAAVSRGIGTIARGSLPDGLPFAQQRFHAIGLFDVLEHLPQPVESLKALGNTLTPHGALVLTVPANPWLWGPHDIAHQHLRRYTPRTLREHLAQANLRVEYLSHFNTLLMPLAIAQRLRERLFGYDAEDLLVSAPVNRALYRIFRAESRWIPQHQLPIGVSLLAIARRTEASGGTARA